ncbi:uncharacterized protein LOC6562791 [Drosophila grimshawi]|uniref:GH11390 n=1 Tax=Drosophila grimshawi TaxID=7222 RepID=B4JA49_DROGR|nr:uncharacterized protein LOC6562791 [Drosophila grimshawi]EDW03723.1 GH11390 [Drosophila grimshawi]
MSLPSMVERSGGRLVVRSLVSGATVYQMVESNEVPAAAAAAAPVATTHPQVGAELLERQLPLLQDPMMPPNLPQVMQEIGAAKDAQVEEELPQCKIRRNYSCHACAFFTQNPRIHLSHMRDVHGEKIMINECKLCLYASRHFQKLVRHMKMVHGCTDDDGSGLLSRRHCNREARMRRLEESIEAPCGPTLKQLKCELELQEQQLQHNVDAYNRQQQWQQLQLLATSSANIFSMAFVYQLSIMPPTPITNLKDEEPPRETTTQSQSVSENVPQPDEALDLSSGTEISIYHCKKCPYNTPIRSRFKKHVKYHSMPLIKCNSCDFHSPYKWNLDRHTKNHGANGYFQCRFCNFSTNIKQSLTIHELNHHLTFKPSTSQQQTPAESALEEASPSPALPLSDLPPISCSHCQQCMPNATELANHLQHCEPAVNNTTQLATDMELTTVEDYRNDLSYCGVETAPGYGEVTEQLPPEDADAVRKVFKCPHCSFWAATASRFHVHIVGHLNRRPFECSLCSYRSNWRWDITKHIRLKAMRDKQHNHAQVLMNDETGRRNYAKYNQYLTLMKVNANQTVDGRTMRCGEMLCINLEEAPETQVGQDAQMESSSALDLTIPGKSTPRKVEQTHKKKKANKPPNSDELKKRSLEAGAVIKKNNQNDLHAL